MLNLNEHPPGEHLSVLLSNGKYATVIVDQFLAEMGDSSSHLLVVDSCTYWHVDRHGTPKHRQADIRILGVIGPMTCVDEKQPTCWSPMILAIVAFVALSVACQAFRFW